LADRAAALRLAFDRSFAERPRPAVAQGEDFLAIGLGAVAHAIRLSEIDGFVAGKPIVRIPSRAAALLGVAGFRGAIVPVYDLRTLLGYAVAETPRWLVIASGAAVAFAFDAFDRHLRVSRDMILSRETGDGSGQFVREVFRDGDLTRSIVHLPSVVDGIKQLALQISRQRNNNHV
jgi:purine-binding chemotaxis protein CheW